MYSLQRIVVLGLLAAVLGGCQPGRVALAMVQSKASFTQCTADPRLMCEPGSEAFAASVAPLVPKAIETVAREQGRVFAAPVIIYTYATRESFARHGGVSPGVAGVAWVGGAHLSPRLASDRALEERVLTHELSHLHLLQQTGWLAGMRLPVWFIEGLATWVSGGGGAEGTVADGALFELRQGRHFEPDETSSLLSRKMASAYGLRDNMFYRQASLFVGFLHDTDPDAFQRLLRKLDSKLPLGEAVQASYRKPLGVLWEDFLRHIG